MFIAKFKGESGTNYFALCSKDGEIQKILGRDYFYQMLYIGKDINERDVTFIIKVKDLKEAEERFPEYFI